MNDKINSRKKGDVELMGCPWCNGTPILLPLQYHNTGRVFGYKIHCATCHYEKTRLPGCWQMGTEAAAEICRATAVLLLEERTT